MRRLGIGWLAVPACVFCLLVFALPLALLLLESLRDGQGWTLDGYRNFLGSAYSWQVTTRTLRLAVLTTLICIVIGYPAAFALARARGIWQALFVAALLLPLSLSVIVKAFGWTVLLRSNGVVNRLLMASGLTDAPMRLIFTETGLLIGITNIFLPFMILPIFSVIQQIDPRLTDAAATLGAGPIHGFMRVVVPLTMPGVVAGVTLVFSMSIAAYVIPTLLMGDRYQTLSTTIATSFLYLQDPQRGSVAGVVLLMLSLLVVGASVVLARKVRATP